MNENKGKSSISILDRALLQLDGVEDVLSFDESAVYLKTTLGTLNIDGKDLHIQNLSLENGALSVTGRIDGLYYVAEEGKSKKGLFFRKS